MFHLSNTIYSFVKDVVKRDLSIRASQLFHKHRNFKCDECVYFLTPSIDYLRVNPCVKHTGLPIMSINLHSIPYEEAVEILEINDILNRIKYLAYDVKRIANSYEDFLRIFPENLLKKYYGQLSSEKSYIPTKEEIEKIKIQYADIFSYILIADGLTYIEGL